MLLTCAISIALLAAGRSSPLEAFGFVTGVICVWLAAKEHVWNWPIGLVNAGAYAFVFLRERLFADAGLQVVYVILGALGWFWWIFRGENKKEIHIEPTPRIQWIPLA